MLRAFRYVWVTVVVAGVAIGLTARPDPLPRNNRPPDALYASLSVSTPVLDLGGAETTSIMDAQARAEAEAAEAAHQAELERLTTLEAARLRAEQARIQAPIPRVSGCGYETLIRQTWPASQGDKAVAVAMRESGCTNTARNPSGATSIFQLMLPLHNGLYEAVGCDPVTQAFDAECNVKAAFLLWQGSGWAPWGM